MSTSQSRTLKILLLTTLYAFYLVLSFFLAGQTAYTFAREHMGTVAYITLALLYAFGTIIFAMGLRTLLKKPC